MHPSQPAVPVPTAADLHAASTAVAVREIPPSRWVMAYPLIRQLRPELDLGTFLRRAYQARTESGYALYGAFDECPATHGACLGVLGVRAVTDLLHGAHLYVDDLVVDAAARSRGVGARLLAHVETLAGVSGAAGVRLSTGIDHAPARRFYEREGWAARAVTYKKGFSG